MDLTQKKCLPCEGGVAALNKTEAEKFLQQIPRWQLNSEATMIERRFEFKNFYHTMAFINMVAWVANKENHHPVLEASYNYCVLRYYTHAIQGLSENDFICAAKINQLFNDE